MRLFSRDNYWLYIIVIEEGANSLYVEVVMKYYEHTSDLETSCLRNYQFKC